MIRVFRWACPGILLVLLVAPSRLLAADPGGPDSTHTALVTSLSGSTIYVNAGRLDGLEIGVLLPVHRGGENVASIRIEHLASHRAACSLVTGGIVQAGDQVVFLPATPPPATVPATQGPAPATTRKGGSWARRQGLRGRFGLRYLTVRNGEAGGGGFSQPSLDVRIDGTRVGGSDCDLAVEVRSIQTWRPAGLKSPDATTRVRRLSVSRQSKGSPLRLSAGRLAQTEFTSSNLLDGVLGEYLRPRFGAGVFAGSQPVSDHWRYSNDTREFGGYVRYQNAPFVRGRWSISAAGISSSTLGESNRDFLILRGQASNPRWTGFISQEIDVNRGWRREAENSTISWTSTFASLQVRASDRLTLSTGFDNRRNIRDYDTRDTAESLFDEAYRQGWSGGARVVPLHWLTLGADVRLTYAGPAQSDISTLTWRVSRTGGFLLDLTGRHSMFHTSMSSGWLHSWGCSRDIGSGRHAEFHAGLRDEVRTGGSVANVTHWYGASLDVAVGRSIYLLGSADVTRGDLETNDQFYLSFGYQL